MTFSSLRSYACSDACQQVHVHCRGCGVLEGPEHAHRLREGYCYALVSPQGETGQGVLVPAVRSCWALLDHLRRLRSSVSA